MMEKVTGGYRKQQNGAPHKLYPSPNLIHVIKPRMVRWEWHVAGMRKIKSALFSGKYPKKKDGHQGYLVLGGPIILK
jgi:hypothetical protein